MPEPTGNRWMDPDSMFDDQGKRRMEPDGQGGMRPVKGRIANPGNIVDDQPFLGVRGEGARKYGKQFYEEPTAQATTVAPPPANPVPPVRTGDAVILPYDFDNDAKLVQEIGAFFTAVKEGKDPDAQATLQEIGKREYGRAGEPRRNVRGALSRAGIRKE